MKLREARVLLTGGAGGIGTAMADELLQRGAAVLLVDRDQPALDRALEGPLAKHGARVAAYAADLTLEADRERLVSHARRWQGGINVLINNAGVSQLVLLEGQSPAAIELAVAVNVTAPIQLCRALLPHLLAQPEARILNTGSVFAHIGYPAYAVYSATKFAMRGFSEALRRELAGTTVRVQLLSPRATRTGINSSAVNRMNAELGVAMDAPDVVARAACRVLEKDVAEAVVGWPEKFFARLNAVLPRLVDGALRKQLPVIRRHAAPDPAPQPASVRPAASTR